MTKLQDRLKPDSIIKMHYGDHTQSCSPKFIIGYWSIRGLGAPIRMLLSAAQIDHWVVLYNVKENTNEDNQSWDKSSWLNDKEWLEKEYPLINLPFLVDCTQEKVLSQSNAILSYLGRELTMLGSTTWEAGQCDELLSEMDLRNLMVQFAYKKTDMAESSITSTSGMKQEAEQLIQNANRHFHRLESHLKKQYPQAQHRLASKSDWHTQEFLRDSVCHLVSRRFSAPDFHLWEMLDQYQGLCVHLGLPNCLGESTMFIDKTGTSVFPHLKEFHECFIRLKKNNVYAQMYGSRDSVWMMHGAETTQNESSSHDGIKLPYNNPYARFGSEPKQNGRYMRGQSAPWKGQGTKEQTHVQVDTDNSAVDGRPTPRKRKSTIEVE